MRVMSLLSTFSQWADSISFGKRPERKPERKNEPSPSDRMIDRVDIDSLGRNRHSEVLRNGNVSLTIWEREGSTLQLVKTNGSLVYGQVGLDGKVTPRQLSDFDIPADLKPYCVEGNIPGPANPTRSTVDRPH